MPVLAFSLKRYWSQKDTRIVSLFIDLIIMITSSPRLLARIIAAYFCLRSGSVLSGLGGLGRCGLHSHWAEFRGERLQILITWTSEVTELSSDPFVCLCMRMCAQVCTYV